MAAHRWSWGFGRRWRFRVFVGSGGSRVRGGAAEERVGLSEILDASVGHSEVCIKLGNSGMEYEVLGFRCRRLIFAGGVGRLVGIFLKAVFRLFEEPVGVFEFEFDGTHAGPGAS